MQSTTLPCLQGRCYFAYKGVGQLTYKGVPSCKTSLQASDKQHSFQPRFLTINHSNSTFSKDTFLLIRELKSVTPLQANRLLPYKQGNVVRPIIINVIIQITHNSNNLSLVVNQNSIFGMAGESWDYMIYNENMRNNYKRYRFSSNYIINNLKRNAIQLKN
ncbi:Hypothetical_protein [Hexamita inflata]|uniref:Hypothetical_protein n=1 Tax=Hexamita inflata TaxID=28002 RepID=A0AA86TCE6_9EUKA|nr:Hypothetical protein HINF_LOCUS1486 [Hexamita inflata]